MAIKILKKNLKETLELTFNAKYISAKSTDRKGGWGVWEAVREFLQNAKDADDLGHEQWIYYTHPGKKTKGGKLHLTNKGVSFGRDALILGGTTKDGDARQRGQFGEGFKLASAVLLDHGCSVYIENGDEIWVPRLGTSERFNGAEILLFDVYAHPEPKSQYHVVVEGLSPKDYRTIKSRCLFLDKPKKRSAIELGARRILLDNKHIGKLYCRGLFVAALPDPASFGYDLPVDLDRDRRLADPWSLRHEIREAVKLAVTRRKIEPKTFLRILEAGSTIEATVFAEYDSYGTGKFYDEIAKEFVKEHGENAVPVADISQSVEGKHHGIKGVVVSSAVKSVVEKVTGTFESKKAKAAYDVKTRCSADDLSEEELGNLAWATGLLNATEAKDHFERLNVVEFVGTNVLGLWKGDEREILIARGIVSDRKQLISTLVHEAAHWDGSRDGSVEHRDNCDSLFATIIVGLTKNC